jgi:hypothetical protein
MIRLPNDEQEMGQTARLKNIYKYKYIYWIDSAGPAGRGATGGIGIRS